MKYKDGKMERMIYFGSRFSMTAANADQFYLVPPGIETSIAFALLEKVKGSVPIHAKIDEDYKKYISEDELNRVAN